MPSPEAEISVQCAINLDFKFPRIEDGGPQKEHPTEPWTLGRIASLYLDFMLGEILAVVEI